MKFFNNQNRHVATLSVKIGGDGLPRYRVSWQQLPKAPMTKHGYGRQDLFHTLDDAISNTVQTINKIWP